MLPVPVTILLLAVAALGQKQPPEANKTVAVALTQAWIDGLGDQGLILNEAVLLKRMGNSYVYESVELVFNPKKPDVFVDLVFDQPIEAHMDLEDVKESFEGIALINLPTPGLGLDDVWNVTPQTLHSFLTTSEGASIISFDGGVVTIFIETECYAVLGHRKQNGRLDTELRDDDWFQVHKSFQMELALEATLVN